MERARFIKSKWHMGRKSIDPSEVSGKEIARNVHILIASSYLKNICFRPVIISSDKALRTVHAVWDKQIVLTGRVRFSVFAPCNAARLLYADEVLAIYSSWSSTDYDPPSSHVLVFFPHDVSFFLFPHRHSFAREEIFLLLYQLCYGC